MTYIIGIDEAGRGPLAGPVSVGVVKIHKDFDKAFFQSIKDSKKLTPLSREDWFRRVKEAKKEGKLDFKVSLVSPSMIDKRGISFAIRLGIKRCLQKLNIKETDQIFLDGSLHAPKEFLNQETIIKGDEKIPVISLASICAKVTRDRYMVRLSKKYPLYGFEIHKGYGTLSHRNTIRKYGQTIAHRTTFLKNMSN